MDNTFQPTVFSFKDQHWLYPACLTQQPASPMKFGSQKQDLPAGTRTQGRSVTIKSSALSSSTLILFILSSRSLNVLKRSQTDKFNTLNKIKSLIKIKKKRQKFKIIIGQLKPSTTMWALFALLTAPNWQHGSGLFWGKLQCKLNNLTSLDNFFYAEESLSFAGSWKPRSGQPLFNT